MNEEEKIFDIRAAIQEYYCALDRREHGAIAQNKAFEKIQAILGMCWNQGDSLKKPKTCLTDGSPVTPDHREIDPVTKQQKGYVVLCPEERAKGFVRPLRKSYKHIGKPPKYPLRDLTDEEKGRYSKFGYVKFEAYPESEAPTTGKFWTQEQLGRMNGCGTITTMSLSLAETYARKPSFYGATFCARCGNHFPVGEHGEFVWIDESGKETSERVGT